MTAAQLALFELFKKLEIETVTYTHEPLYTVEESFGAHARLNIPGPHCKSLFLKDNKGRLYLIEALAQTKISLKSVAAYLGAPGLRFADQEMLLQTLGVLPGSVTPFGLINDKTHAVTVIIDELMLKEKILTFHPLRNDATVTITPADLMIFLEHCKNRVVPFSFDTLPI